jgi:transposase
MDMNQIYEQLLGLKELQVNQVVVGATRIEVYCESKLVEGHCPVCLQKCNCVKQTYERKVKDLSISGKEVWLHLISRQLVCKDCNRHFYEQFSFVDPKESVTKRYAQRLYDLSQGVELQYVVVRENLCWQTVNRIFGKYARKQVDQHNGFGQVSRLGIDEIALKKGHKHYVAVVVDLDTGQVLDLLEDRSKQALVKYFQAKGPDFCARIKLFCSDMWEGYLNAAKEVFPNAVLVADRFHFFSRLQKAVDNCRRYLRGKYAKAPELKQLKWLLLKNPDRLTAAHKQQLHSLFAHPDYELLKATYEAKNTFRAILQSDLNPQQAQAHIQAWLTQLEKTTNRFLTDFVNFYATWNTYILNYFQGRYSTGIIEGINNKIKSIKRRAFGFSNFNNFKLRVQTAFG